jgi:hypothetical protein
VTLRDDERKAASLPRRPRRKTRIDTGGAALDPSTRVVIEDVIRELEFEGPSRWASVIERLRSVL